MPPIVQCRAAFLQAICMHLLTQCSGGSRNLGRGDPSIKNAREARANF